MNLAIVFQVLENQVLCIMIITLKAQIMDTLEISVEYFILDE